MLLMALLTFLFSLEVGVDCFLNNRVYSWGYNSHYQCGTNRTRYTIPFELVENQPEFQYDDEVIVSSCSSASNIFHLTNYGNLVNYGLSENLASYPVPEVDMSSQSVYVGMTEPMVQIKCVGDTVMVKSEKGNLYGFGWNYGVFGTGNWFEHYVNVTSLHTGVLENITVIDFSFNTFNALVYGYNRSSNNESVFVSTGSVNLLGLDWDFESLGIFKILDWIRVEDDEIIREMETYNMTVESLFIGIDFGFIHIQNEVNSTSSLYFMGDPIFSGCYNQINDTYQRGFRKLLFDDYNSTAIMEDINNNQTIDRYCHESGYLSELYGPVYIEKLVCGSMSCFALINDEEKIRSAVSWGDSMEEQLGRDCTNNTNIIARKLSFEIGFGESGDYDENFALEDFIVVGSYSVYARFYNPVTERNIFLGWGSDNEFQLLNVTGGKESWVPRYLPFFSFILGTADEVVVSVGLMSDAVSLSIPFFDCFEESLFDECFGRGVCTGQDVCVCYEDWYGDKCDVYKCFGVYTNETEEVCSGEDHGTCVSTDTCVCNDQNFKGSTCEIMLCYGLDPVEDKFDVCSGMGVCFGPSQCECVLGWYGEECECRIMEYLWPIVLGFIAFCLILPCPCCPIVCCCFCWCCICDFFWGTIWTRLCLSIRFSRLRGMDMRITDFDYEKGISELKKKKESVLESKVIEMESLLRSKEEENEEMERNFTNLRKRYLKSATLLRKSKMFTSSETSEIWNDPLWNKFAPDNNNNNNNSESSKSQSQEVLTEIYDDPIWDEFVNFKVRKKEIYDDPIWDEFVNYKNTQRKKKKKGDRHSISKSSNNTLTEEEEEGKSTETTEEEEEEEEEEDEEEEEEEKSTEITEEEEEEESTEKEEFVKKKTIFRKKEEEKRERYEDESKEEEEKEKDSSSSGTESGSESGDFEGF